jgi:hypothetical protein
MTMPWSSAGRLAPIVPPHVKTGWPPSRWSLRALWLTTALFAVTLVAGVAPAAAKTPCWKKVVQDWYADGRIDGAYSASCLSEARKRIPEDLKVYSSFDEQARQARQQSGRRLAAAGSGSAERPKGPQVAEEPSRGLFKVALDKTSPRNADSVPLPLLILAGLALLLIAAGAAGLVARRLRARRAASP